MRLPRTLLPGVGTALVVALAVSACGGSDEEPDDAAGSPAAATVEAFCPVWEEALTELATLGTTEPSEEAWDKVRSGLEELSAIGAPGDLSDDATEGLAIFTDSLLALDHRDFARLDGAANLPGVTDEQEAQSRTFTEEAAQLCGKLG
ncbi:hypothetical protein HNR19_004107 [Nocardioides thalensis]|uniref:Lipoprotein n=1 Tax=Nocardioides thalensis TaxID=1914755 RepID=A0A853C868_9ACTN|nr:hypothetical protein [Nocardioides thalensis]NYJ03409.1 hypothetical protein [Nocardioides thalensis]